MSEVESPAEPVGRTAARLWCLRLGLFVCLLSVYMLVYAGHAHSIDGMSIFATAISLGQHGRLDTNIIGWAQWADRPGEKLGRFDDEYNVYSKKAPGMAWLATPLVVLARLVPWLGKQRTVLLLNPLATAATAVLLLDFARALGFTERAGLVAAGLFGLTGLPPVYTRFLFSEPVVGAGLTVAALAGLRLRADDGPVWAGLVAGAGLALALSSNLAYGMLVPVFAVYWVGSSRGRGEVARRLGAALSPVALTLGLLAWYNMTRFGNPLESGYHFQAGEGFTTPVWFGVWGLLLSPARGYLWFHPAGWVGALGWPALRRRSSSVAWLGAAIVGWSVILFGSWWAWWGGYGWGPRFLLPMTPFVMLGALPLIERAFEPRQVIARAGVGLSGLAGLAAAITGCLVDFNAYELWLREHFPRPTAEPMRYVHADPALFQPRLSPLIGHWRLLGGGVWPDLAWLDLGRVEWVALAAMVVSFGAGVAALVLSLRSGTRRWGALGGGALAASALTINVVLGRYQAIPPDPLVPNLVDLPDVLAGARECDGLLLLVPEITPHLLELDSTPRVYGAPVNVPPDDSAAQGIFANAQRNACRLWLITWYPPGSPDNWYEAALWRESASVRDEWVDGYRLLLFDLRPPPTDLEATNWQVGPLRLTGYATATYTSREAIDLIVSLKWVAVEGPDADYVGFVHVTDAGGAIVAQQDRPPLGGYSPTATWRPGETVEERYGFVLPAGVRPDGLKLRVGFYSWPELVRLPVTGPDGQPMADDAVILPIR